MWPDVGIELNRGPCIPIDGIQVIYKNFGEYRKQKDYNISLASFGTNDCKKEGKAIDISAKKLKYHQRHISEVE